MEVALDSKINFKMEFKNGRKNDGWKNKQDIRFIDSTYNDLFKMFKGGFIQVGYPNETVIKQCVFIDPYHT